MERSSAYPSKPIKGMADRFLTVLYPNTSHVVTSANTFYHHAPSRGD